SHRDAFGKLFVARLAEAAIDFFGEILKRRQADAERHPGAAEKCYIAGVRGTKHHIWNISAIFQEPHWTLDPDDCHGAAGHTTRVRPQGRMTASSTTRW